MPCHPATRCEGPHLPPKHALFLCWNSREWAMKDIYKDKDHRSYEDQRLLSCTLVLSVNFLSHRKMRWYPIWIVPRRVERDGHLLSVRIQIRKSTLMVSATPLYVMILTVSRLDSGFDPLDDLDTYEFVNYHDTGSAQSATSAMPVPPAYGPPPTVGGPVSHAESTTTHPKFIKAYHPQRSGTHGRDLNLLERLDGDKYADIRRSTNNYHYPFESDTEWEVVQWITRSSLTQQDIDAFLKLKYVSCQSLWGISLF